MQLNGIPIGSIWTFMRWLPGFFLKKIFPPQRLSNLVYFDIQPRGSSCTLNLGEISSITVYLNLINLSPFNLALDRGIFEFILCGVPIKTNYLRSATIKPGQIFIFSISETLPDNVANHIAKSLQSNPSDGTLIGHIEFNCKLHSFSKDIGNLAGVKFEILNLSWRC